MSLANIEALAQNESGNTVTYSLSCAKSGVKMCKATCGIHQVTMENYGDGKVGTFTCTGR